MLHLSPDTANTLYTTKVHSPSFRAAAALPVMLNDQRLMRAADLFNWSHRFLLILKKVQNYNEVHCNQTWCERPYIFLAHRVTANPST